MERRTEFPELEAWRAELEHQYYEAQKQWNDSVYAGKPDGTAQQWMFSIRRKLDEVTYSLKVLGSQGNRIDVTGHTLLIAMVSYAVTMLAIVALFVRFLGA